MFKFITSKHFIMHVCVLSNNIVESYSGVLKSELSLIHDFDEVF